MRRLVELDVARAVAIVLALGWHFYTPTGIWFVDALQAPGRAIGWAGVDLFFVLSGLLVGGLIFGEISRTGGFNARRFLIRRAFKIWPVMYLYVALVVVTGRYQPMEVVPQTLLHIQNYWTTPLNHLWSLAVEEQFYLLFAFLAASFGLRVSNASRVPAVLATIMVVAPLLRCIAVAMDVPPHVVKFQTQFRVDSLACGVLLAYLKTFRPAAFAGLARQKWAMAAAVAAGVVFLVLLRDNERVIGTAGFSVAMLSAAAFLLLLEGAFPHPNMVVRTAAWVGTYSYALYVFQFVMYRALERGWERMVHSAPPPLVLLAMKYLGALVLAVLITRAIERPLLTVRNRLFPAT